MEFPKFANEYRKAGIELLPHRSPFLFVDTLLAADESGALGEYTFTLEKNDFFKGHFPDFPVVPGVILIEAMSQVAGAGLIARGILGDKPSFLFAKVEEAKFRKPVRPGDKLVTVVENIRLKRIIGVFTVKGYVGEELVAEAVVTCMLNPQAR